MRADNSRHLTTAARQRAEQTRARAVRALRRLDETGKSITFEAVAAEAGVSRSWLYISTRHSSRDPSPANAPTTVARGTTDPPATASHRGIPAAQARSDVPADAPPRGRQPPTATGPSRSPRLGTHSPDHRQGAPPRHARAARRRAHRPTLTTATAGPRRRHRPQDKHAGQPADRTDA